MDTRVFYTLSRNEPVNCLEAEQRQSARLACCASFRRALKFLQLTGQKEGKVLEPAPRILIVEDEPSVRALFEEILSGDGYYMTAVGTAGQAVYPIRNFEFDLNYSG